MCVWSLPWMLWTLPSCVDGKGEGPADEEATVSDTGGGADSDRPDTGDEHPTDTSSPDTSGSDTGGDTAPEQTYEYKGQMDGYFHLSYFILYPLGRKVYDWTCDDATSQDQDGNYEFRVDASESPAADWSDRCTWDETLGTNSIHYSIEFLEQEAETGNYVYCLSFDDEGYETSWVQPHATTFELVFDTETTLMEGTCAEGGRCADNSDIEHDCSFRSAWRRPLDAGK